MDGAKSDAVDEASWASFASATSQSSCDSAQPWAGFYTTRTVAQQEQLCDLARELGPFEAKFRLHHENTSTDTTSAALTATEWADLAADALVSQSAFDNEAATLLGGWWASRTADQKRGFRDLVLAW